MKDLIIKDAKVVNEGKILRDTSLLIRNGIIEKIFRDSVPEAILQQAIVIDASGKFLLPGVIDDQVHFREPGLTHKGDISSESRAAVAGGITSFMEMPNTIPQATNQEILAKKYDRAAEVSLANYSFYIGATNDNLEELLKTDPANVCGIKVFMGSSTGNMLVDNPVTLSSLFRQSKMLIAVHCEDENIVQANLAVAVEKFGENIPIAEHPKIRDTSACFSSSSKAVELAKNLAPDYTFCTCRQPPRLPCSNRHRSRARKLLLRSVSTIFGFPMQITRNWGRRSNGIRPSNRAATGRRFSRQSMKTELMSLQPIMHPTQKPKKEITISKCLLAVHW